MSSNPVSAAINQNRDQRNRNRPMQPGNPGPSPSRTWSSIVTQRSSNITKSILTSNYLSTLKVDSIPMLEYGKHFQSPKYKPEFGFPFQPRFSDNDLALITSYSPDSKNGDEEMDCFINGLVDILSEEFMEKLKGSKIPKFNCERSLEYS
ncbi:hypothetical protein JTB14_014163 [Gonioctena quinquepunctata]|nr:hypothetical protein JTB14_014163 [Gonioctena quinquepunctata]